MPSLALCRIPNERQPSKHVWQARLDSHLKRSSLPLSTKAHEIEHINQIAHRQLQSAHAVVHIMHNVAEYTRRSSTSTYDASRNMERLARLVERLRASVEAFKLRDNQRYVIPNTNINMSLDEDESPLTVSGAFRKVSTLSQPLFIPNESYSAQKASTSAEPISEPGLRSNSRQLSFPQCLTIHKTGTGQRYRPPMALIRLRERIGCNR